MAVYHVVLFKLKPNVTPEQLKHLKTVAEALVGKIPGLLKLDMGPPLAVTAARSKGFDMGLVAILEKPDQILPYGTHPAHLEVHALREQMCDDTLAYDVEF